MPNSTSPDSPVLASYPVQLKVVPAAMGLTWFKQGLTTFFKQPLALGGLFFMALVFFQLLSWGLSVFGLLIWVLLTPAVNVGFMAGMADAEHSHFPLPKRLLTAFSKGPSKTKSLLILGGIYIAGLFLLAALAGLLFGNELAAMAKASQEALGVSTASPAASQAASAAAAGTAPALTELIPGFLWFFLALGVPVTLLTWHAPGLVFWYGASPIKAMFFSAVACWRNLGAMLVYFLCWAALTAPVMLASSALQGQTETGMNLLLMAVLAPLSLALGAAFTLSSFYSFRGSFVQHASIP